MEDRRSARMKYSAIAILMIAMGPFLLSSCATLRAPSDSPKHLTCRSDEYIVCKLKSGETSAALAEMFLGDKKKSWVIEDANEGVAFRKNDVIVIPLKEENIGGLATDGFQVVPILCYHRFAVMDSKSVLCIRESVFDRQMKYLKDNGYRVVSLKQLLDFLQYNHGLPKKAVAITLDDGYRSAYDIAFPILKKYGFSATLLIYTDYVGVSGKALTWDQIREMKDAGFEVGSQTVSHCDLTKKKEGEDDHAYMTRIKRELLVSKQIIDKKLGQNTLSLAFPYGRYNETALSIANQVGYKIAVSVNRGSNPFFTDPFILKRDQILKEDMRTFISRLKTFYKLSLK